MFVDQPPIVQDPVPFGLERKRQTRGYATRHYGLRTHLLRDPKTIVLHYTASSTYSSAFNTFAANAPDVEYGERPGVCAHYLIGKDGKINQLVSLRFICRHTVGLNHVSIGIEHVGTSDAQVMGNARQLGASLKLVRWLQERYGIPTRFVIGHNESLRSPFYREDVKRFRGRTHGDFPREVARKYRSAL